MNQKANITYPTSWTYKIIATSVVDIQQAVAGVLKNKERSLTPSKTSSKGKFISMDLKLNVISEEDRTSISHQIYAQQGIKMVL